MTESCYRVSAVFTFKDTASKDKFVDFCNGENGLSVTRAWKGCISLKMYESSGRVKKIKKDILNIVMRMVALTFLEN